ncbi:MAG: recombinase RecA [Oscillibacter sp.]|jgi:recombination protein RecA|nr:recombinase RecA [Oscillibacter sp.]
MAKEKAPIPSAAPAADKKKAISTAMSQIEKMYGKGSIMRFGDKADLNIEYIPTGSLALDVALGIGGLPRGRIVEIYGPESSGKTTLALHVVAEAQKKGGEVAFVDAEHALDPTYARALGVKVEDLLISQPDAGEQALEITEALVRSGAIDVIVVDSVAALVPRAEIEGEMGDSYVGLHARLMSQALRKLTAAISKTNTIVIFINQLREKVGVMYGNPEVTTGGRALKFYASVRIDIRRVESIKVNGEIVGNRTRAKVVKNKMAPPFREAEFDIMYGEGIVRESELVDLGVKLDLMQKSGSWFSMGETRIGQGRDAAKRYLQENPEIRDQLEAEVRKNFDKLMSNQSRAAAKAAGRAVDVSADDFDDSAAPENAAQEEDREPIAENED